MAILKCSVTLTLITKRWTHAVWGKLINYMWKLIKITHNVHNSPAANSVMSAGLLRSTSLWEEGGKWENECRDSKESNFLWKKPKITPFERHKIIFFCNQYITCWRLVGQNIKKWVVPDSCTVLCKCLVSHNFLKFPIEDDNVKKMLKLRWWGYYWLHNSSTPVVV